MIDCETIPKPMQSHLAVHDHSLDGDTLHLQNGGRPSDISQSYPSYAYTFTVKVHV